MNVMPAQLEIMEWAAAGPNTVRKQPDRRERKKEGDRCDELPFAMTRGEVLPVQLTDTPGAAVNERGRRGEDRKSGRKDQQGDSRRVQDIHRIRRCNQAAVAERRASWFAQAPGPKTSSCAAQYF